MIASGRVKKNLDLAVRLIRDGDVVAFPTETVYGLGANALNEKAVERIFKVKGRPFHDPLIVHIADEKQLELLTEPLPEESKKWAETLMARFWPGPLTLIFRKKKNVPGKVTAGLDTVAVRMPRNLIARALIKNSECPIAAPSANRFQSISPTTAEAVESELGEKVPLILDGGPCEVGVESTVLSLVGGKPVILRHGGTSQEDIEAALGFNVEAKTAGEEEVGAKISPGLLSFHYAPRKPLKLFDLADLRKLVSGKRGLKKRKTIGLLCFSKEEEKIFKGAGFYKIYVLSPRGQLVQAARELFQTLRTMDRDDSRAIYALKCPDERLGRALNDRLLKAVHDA